MTNAQKLRDVRREIIGQLARLECEADRYDLLGLIIAEGVGGHCLSMRMNLLRDTFATMRVVLDEMEPPPCASCGTAFPHVSGTG